MAEATAIVNARPLVPLSTDPENLCVLSTAALLTQKTEETKQDSKNLCVGNVYASQWKNVQSLAEMFWDRLKTGTCRIYKQEENGSRCRKPLKLVTLFCYATVTIIKIIGQSERWNVYKYFIAIINWCASWMCTWQGWQGSPIHFGNSIFASF